MKLRFEELITYLKSTDYTLIETQLGKPRRSLFDITKFALIEAMWSTRAGEELVGLFVFGVAQGEILDNISNKARLVRSLATFGIMRPLGTNTTLPPIPWRKSPVWFQFISKDVMEKIIYQICFWQFSLRSAPPAMGSLVIQKLIITTIYQNIPFHGLSLSIPFEAGIAVTPSRWKHPFNLK